MMKLEKWLVFSPMNFVRNKLWLLILIFYACAHQVSPSGGPEDKTPPRVLSSFPEEGAVRVPTNVEVEFVFSESMDRDTFGKAIFISPDPGDQLKFEFHRRAAKVKFPKPLLPDRTYVITLGTDLHDSHGNPLANSFTLAFSTGDSLDHGEISGKVYDEKPQGVAVWAYILPDSTDTLRIDPGKRKGDYATQAGKTGEYRIPFISRGGYRVFAVRDKARNGLYDPVEDEIGVPARDIFISRQSGTFAGINFRLTRADTTSPGLSSVSMPDHSTLEVHFDEEIIAQDTTWSKHFTLLNLQQGDTLQIVAASRFPLDPKLFYLFVKPVGIVTKLRLKAHGITDQAGNPLDTAFAYFDFWANAAADTISPRIVRLFPADSAQNIPIQEPVRVIFNEWMHQPDSARGMIVLDSEQKRVSGNLFWQNPFELEFKPENGWQSRGRYTIKMNPGQLRDFSGNTLFDTLGTRTFTTLNQDTLASIAGQVVLRHTLNDSIPIFLQARQVKGGQSEYFTRVQRDGTFVFANVLPGVYIIEGYLDRNRNGQYDFGQPVPFVPSELFFVYSDSIKVRSKWPNVGNNILIR